MLRGAGPPRREACLSPSQPTGQAPIHPGPQAGKISLNKDRPSLNKTQIKPHVTLQQKLSNIESQGYCTWALINKHRGEPKLINILLNLADSLELHTLNLIQLQNLRCVYQKTKIQKPRECPTNTTSEEVQQLIKFYKQPTIELKDRSKTSQNL